MKRDLLLKRLKIVLIGAGSRQFAARLIGDLFQWDQSYGSELVLVDVDEVALRRTWALAERLIEHEPDRCRISYTTNRREALQDADFVVTSIAIQRAALWRQDYMEAVKLGFNHCFGENGGPGALFHTLRNLPHMMAITRDMEELCPKAWLLNFTNPENRVCLAVSRHSSIKAVGLCHSVNGTLDMLSEFLDIPRERLDAKVGGVNHMNWMVELWDTETGEDLFPRFKAQIAESGPPEKFDLCCALWERFGVFPTTGDSHVGEYFAFGKEFFTTGFDYDKFREKHRTAESELREVIEGRVSVTDWLARPLGREIAVSVIDHLHYQKTGRILSVIVPNRGAIANLENDSVIETAGLFEGGLVRGEPIGELPAAAAAVTRREQEIQDLVVEAWATNSRKLALQALMLDPIVDSLRRAELLLDRMLDLQKEYLPELE